MVLDFARGQQPIAARRALTEDLRQYAVSNVVLSPTRWATYSSTVELRWKKVKFDEVGLQEVPDDSPGLYTFIVDPGVADHPSCSLLLYLGKAERQSLRRRLRQYFSEENNPKGRAPIQDMISRWRSHLYVCFTLVEDPAIVDELENALLEAFIPPLNQQFKGILGDAVRAWRVS